jgi:uncharacterized membrane protein YhaH (DUF805 family)
MGLLFSFEGRITRLTFWMCMIGMTVVSLLVESVLIPPRQTDEPGNAGSFPVPWLIFNLVLFWCVLAVSVKRWHDRDKSGWWVLINLIPLIGWLWALVENGFLRGTEGPNSYGPDPAA